LRAYGIAAAVFALDRLTKWIIETRVGAFDTISVIPGFFDIIHTRNPGAAFSMFANLDSPLRPLLLIGVAGTALGLVAWMLRKAGTLDFPTALGLAFILGGACGNLFDRVTAGSVTDFLEFYIGAYHWPTFNVADSAICTGSGLLILAMLRPKRQTAQT
jgi:signal peptidase II